MDGESESSYGRSPFNLRKAVSNVKPARGHQEAHFVKSRCEVFRGSCPDFRTTTGPR